MDLHSRLNLSHMILEGKMRVVALLGPLVVRSIPPQGAD